MNCVKGAILPPNAVCVSCIGYIGYTGMTKTLCITNQQINSVIVNKDNDPDFVFYLFRSLRRRLRVFDVWMSRRRVGFGTKAPGEALLRKCINPLRYFHPEAAKYRGLSEGDAAVATAYAGDMKLLSPHIPSAGSLDCGRPVREDHAVVFPQPPSEAQLPSSGRGVCVRNAFLLRSPFFKNLKTGACNFSRNRLYCVQGKKKSDCFPPVAAGDLEAVVFYVRSFFSGARSPLRCNHPASLLSLILSQAIPSMYHPLSNGSSLIWLCQIIQKTG